MVIAIDGPAGVGKSTLALHLAERWNLYYLNTGRFYRAVTKLAFDKGLLSETISPFPIRENVVVEQSLIDLAGAIKWEIFPNGIFANGQLLGNELHTKRVDSWVALVSEVPLVRERLNSFFRSLENRMDIVCEGRDMTSEVFPHASVRIFLDASPEVRAARRFQERPEGTTYESILEAIKTRDRIDRNKAVGALRLTEGCLLVDSSDLTIQAVCATVDQIIQDQRT